ncbi:uncharacterized protein LOC128873632 [Hylaeus volcanicus]|uniref:uncharacterized protein LOC128873632 n=1 Tax=Hylaeus volcanicus TaxID=313075 RepID=UPI0023B8302E|nr:uncharacterized protein LOC128873632 [Hylaeus volcanicus]
MAKSICNQSYRNVHYKSDTEYTIIVSRTLLIPSGIWPLRKNDTFLQTSRTIVQIGAIFGLMCFLLVPHVIYTFHDCEDLTRYMKVIAAQVFSLLGIVKFWTMIFNKKQIGQLLTDLELQYKNIECEDDRLVLKRSAKNGRLFTIVYLMIIYGGALPYHIILPFMSERVVKRDNTTQIPLPYLSNYVYFVIEDSPFYEMMFVLQMLISTIILSTNTGISSLIASTVMHACGLFKIVNRKIETFFNDDKDELHVRLNRIIHHHLKAIEFAALIEKSLTIVFLSEIIGNTVIVCFLEYGVLVEWEDHKTFSTITYFVLMTSIFVNVFIITIIGDLLKQESERVGQVLYFMPWYDLPRDIAQNVRMMILRTGRPTNLTAAKIFDVSLQAFCEVCKTSAAYLNFLRTMTMQNPVMAVTKGQIVEHELEKYVNLSIQWNRWLLKPLGIWPNFPDTTRMNKYCSWLLIVTCYILISFFCVPCGLYMIIEAESVYDRIKLFGPLTFCMTAYLKYYSIISRGDDIRECVKCIEWDWNHIKHLEDRDIMISKANFGKRLIKTCAFFMYSGAVFYYVIVPIRVGKVKIEDENVTFIPIAMPFPRQILDTRYSPTNEIIFSIQVLGGVLIHAISAGACSLIAAFAVHACGQMEIIMCWLGHLVDGRPDMCETVDGRIGSIVSQHVRIIKFLALIEKTMSRISLIEVSGCTLDMCLVGYYIIMEWNSKDMTATVTYVIIFTSLFFSIFIFCYIGELVDEQCAMVGETSYMIEWHRLPERKQLSMILVIAMSNATSKLTAGNIVILSLDSFSSVVKTSFAYLNMLRTMV